MWFKLLIPLLFIGCATRYDTYTASNRLPKHYNEDAINRYLLTKYKGFEFEQMRVIYYQDDRYLMDEVIANGSNNRVEVNGLEIIVHCVVNKCNRVILAHNHPGQYFAHPSVVDLDNTDKFKALMKQANITAIAQIIIGEHDANWLN